MQVIRWCLVPLQIRTCNWQYKQNELDCRDTAAPLKVTMEEVCGQAVYLYLNICTIIWTNDIFQRFDWLLQIQCNCLQKIVCLYMLNGDGKTKSKFSLSGKDWDSLFHVQRFLWKISSSIPWCVISNPCFAFFLFYVALNTRKTQHWWRGGIKWVHFSLRFVSQMMTIELPMWNKDSLPFFCFQQTLI